MKTQLSKPARSKARYTEEYKKEALQLWRASGRSAAKVAAELGPNQATSSPGGVSKKLTHPYCSPSRGSIHTSFFSGRGTRQIIST